jgi:hypothetical protein
VNCRRNWDFPLFAISLCLGLIPRFGNSAPVDIAVLSEGASTCGEYMQEPEKQEIRMEWVLGYITGVNSRAPSPESIVGSSFQMPATVIGWLRSYCSYHPLDIMAAAAEALRRDFLNHERRR